MNAFVARLVQDLRQFSASLLESGLAPPSPTLRIAGRSELVLELGWASALVALVPPALAELEQVEAPNRMVEQVVRSPVRAALSRRPGDYEWVGGRLLPSRWSRSEPVLEPDWDAVAWLLYLIDGQRRRLCHVQRRSVKQVEEARAARAGTSRWAVHDAHSLQARLDRIAAMIALVDRAREQAVRYGGLGLRPMARVPSPYPRSRAWAALRRLVAQWSAPARHLPAHLDRMLRTDVAVADLPFLFQRWCGVKLLEALRTLGYGVSRRLGERAVPGRTAGGHARRGHDRDLDRAAARARSPARERLQARGDDVTPDYLLITPWPARPRCVLCSTRRAPPTTRCCAARPSLPGADRRWRVGSSLACP
ncbi:MAG: hypothetical protein U1E76_03745 [Planctomycetota bacterium]